MPNELKRKKRFNVIFCILFLLILSPLISLLAFRYHIFTSYVILVPIGGFVCLIFFAFQETGAKRIILWKTALKMLMIPSAIWVSVFIFGFICWFVSIYLGTSLLLKSIRFPLAGVEGVAVDDTNRVYCLSRFYNRLQVFDGNGQFQKGWFVDLPGGDYRILSQSDNRVAIFLKNRCAAMIYDANGLLISRTKYEKKDFEKIYPKEMSNFSVKDNLNNNYVIISPFLWAQVIKTSVEGNKNIIIKDPVGLWVVTMLFPFVWFALVKIVFVFGARHLLGIKAYVRWSADPNN